MTLNSVVFKNKEVFSSKIVCIGKNYIEHIKELKGEIPENMVIFNKPNSAISSELYHFENTECHYEGEISFIIFDNKIAGVAFGLDLTKRDVQKYLKSKGLPWERAKAFDKSAVFSDFIPINEEDIPNLKIELFINNSIVQYGNYSLMINKPLDILKEITSFITLNDGDIIMTGTPKGVGEYRKSDKFIGNIFIGDDLIINKKWTVK
jgi:2-keto-4-pentenoate hydratase/2-oxohepta-3-ene-1,7-dioic acid hydratase in catechol pathway